MRSVGDFLWFELWLWVPVSALTLLVEWLDEHPNCKTPASVIKSSILGASTQHKSRNLEGQLNKKLSLCDGTIWHACWCSSGSTSTLEARSAAWCWWVWSSVLVLWRGDGPRARGQTGLHLLRQQWRLQGNWLILTFSSFCWMWCLLGVQFLAIKVKCSLRPVLPIQELTCHMGSHCATCHMAEMTFRPLPQQIKYGTWFSDPRGMQGWVDLVGWRWYTHPMMVTHPSAKRVDNV